MLMRINRFSALTAVAVLVPVSAQFGVAGNRRAAGTNFQDLQELAKEKAAREAGGDVAGAGAMGNMQDMLKNALDNPDLLKQFGDLSEQLGPQFGDAIEQMMKLSPEELSAQMEQAMKLLTDGDMVENVVNQKDEIIKSLEQSGAVPPDELARYKADPAYFELKMRESFSQMGQLFENPEYLAKTAETLQGMTKMMADPDAMNEMMQGMMGAMDGLQDDTQIEEARLQFLSGEFGDIPGFKEAFQSPEMQEILSDPVKWRDTVKGGYKDMLSMFDAGAANGKGILDGLLDEDAFAKTRDEL